MICISLSDVQFVMIGASGAKLLPNTPFYLGETIATPTIHGDFGVIIVLFTLISIQ